MPAAARFSILLALLFPGILRAQGRYYHLLVGTYTSGTSEGIYSYRFDTQTGRLSHEYTAKGVENPSFLAASPDRRYVYSVNEGPGGAGEVSAFKFSSSTGRLEFINKQPSGGGAPCYISLSGDGRFLFVANYSGGNLSALPVNPDGSLAPPVQTIQHQGSSINPKRQEKPHVHCAVFSPSGKYLFTPDLGTDKINVYRYRPGRPEEPLAPADPPFAAASAGSGPRHLVFSSGGEYAYLVQELTAAVTVFSHEDGKLTPVQSLPMAAPDFKGEHGAAEIRLSPDGKFLYASNRGTANEITIYAINPENGKLALAGRRSTLGKTPRNFMIDPSGRFLLVANQNSDSIIIFKRDRETGLSGETGSMLTVGNPVYLMMLPAD